MIGYICVLAAVIAAAEDNTASIIKDSTIAVVAGIAGAIVGAILSYYLTLIVERKKQKSEQSREAYQACLQLRKVLADWKNAIADATREESSPHAVSSRLQAIFEHDDFQRQVSDCYLNLKHEPLCDGLFGKTNAFTRQAFESKGRIAMALTVADFNRDYARHRDDARRSLQAVYKEFEDELERVIPLLERKQRL